MTTQPLDKHGPRRGMALALVLLIVAIAVVLGLCFLNAGATSAPVSKLVDQRLEARMVAESGLAMTLAYVQQGTAWRTARAEGQWVTSQAFGGGTFSIWAYDGEDTNGDGVVEGNANFADDAYAPVTFKAVGASGGVRHVVSAVYRPSGPPPVAVADRAEFRNNTLVDGYEAALGPYSPATAVAAASVSSNSTGRPNIKLTDSAVISGSFYFPRQSDPTLALDITRDAKITGNVGKLNVDDIEIPEIVPPDCAPSTTDVVYNGTSTVTMSADVVCRDFKLLGGTILKVPASYKIVCDRDFVIDNTAQIVLTNPHYGYDTPLLLAQGAANNQQIATVVTIPDEVEVRTITAYVQKVGKEVRFALYKDKNGEPGSLIVQTAKQTVPQDTFAWVELPVTPTKISAGTYWLALSVQTGAAQFCYGVGGKTVHRNFDAVANGFLANWGVSDELYARTVNIYLTGNVQGKGGSLEVFTSGKLTIGGSSRVNIGTQVPSRMTFRHDDPDDAGEAVVKSSAIAYATVHAPDATLRVTDQAQFHGLVQASDVILEKNSVVRLDTSGGTTDPAMLIGQSLKMTDAARVEGLGGSPAVVASCAVGSSVIWLRHRAVVKADAYGGPGGAGGNTGIQVGSDAVLTGNKKNLLEAVDMTVPSPPAGLPAAADLKISSGTTTINSSFQSGNMTVDNTGIAEIRGNVTLVLRELHLHNSARLRLAPDAKLTVYVTGRVHLADYSELNVGGDPTRVTLNISGYWVDVSQRVQVCGAVVAPAALVRVWDDAQLFGTVRARWFLTGKNAQVHANVRKQRVRWIEQ